LQSAGSDLGLIEAAAREAGAIARAAFGGSFKSWSKGPDQPVTEIDLAVNALLEERLRGGRPDYGWLSEESPDDAARLARKRVWIIDPIDGTRALIAGNPEFTISIGVAHEGRAVAGAVYNPITEEMYLGEAGAGATLNGAAMQTSDRGVLEGASLFAFRRVLEKKIWASPWPQMQLAARHSLAYRLALVAAGQVDGALLTGLKHEWDIAGGAAILAAAGGRATLLSGAALVFNQPAPHFPGVVAAGARLHRVLIERTSHLGDPRDDSAPKQEAAT
jgi:myo-inositol-1(or 4)-monophosphatase